MNKARRRLQKGRARLRESTELERVSRRLEELERDRQRRHDEFASTPEGRRRLVQSYIQNSIYGKIGRP